VIRTRRSTFCAGSRTLGAAATGCRRRPTTNQTHRSRSVRLRTTHRSRHHASHCQRRCWRMVRSGRATPCRAFRNALIWVAEWPDNSLRKLLPVTKRPINNNFLC
jgi:hypothetical protein